MIDGGYWSATYSVHLTPREWALVSACMFHASGRKWWHFWLNSVGAWFESQLVCQLSWPRFFMVFLGCSRQMPGWYLQLVRDLFLPQPFQSIVRYQPVIWCCAAWIAENIVKVQTNRIIWNLVLKDEHVWKKGCWGEFLYLRERK